LRDASCARVHLVRVTLGLALAALGEFACSDSAAPGRPEPPTELPGSAVQATELIVGRAAVGDRVFLLTDSSQLVTVAAPRMRVTRARVVGLEEGESLWGLGALGDGSLWTLTTRTTLAQVSAEGAILRRIRLEQPHLGLYGWNDRLIYQSVDLDPPSPALACGPPGNGERAACGSLRTRRFAVPRAENWLLDLVACGASRGESLPCWFRDEASIDRVARDGGGERWRLAGVDEPDRAAIVAADTVAHPIWDAYIARDGNLWVLLTDTRTPQAREGKELARYAGDGRLVARVTLPQAARLILWATGDVCTLLGRPGGFARVRLP